jgi:hypothetical protein
MNAGSVAPFDLDLGRCEYGKGVVWTQIAHTSTTVCPRARTHITPQNLMASDMTGSGTNMLSIDSSGALSLTNVTPDCRWGGGEEEEEDCVVCLHTARAYTSLNTHVTVDAKQRSNVARSEYVDVFHFV